MNLFRGGVVIALLAGPLASGCSQLKYEYESGNYTIDQAALSRLENLSDVLSFLGPPTAIGRAGPGAVLMYEDVTVRETQFGINLSYDWLSLIKLVIARGDAEIETVAIVVDGRGDVVSRSTSSERRTVGYGGAFNLIFQVVPVVNTKDYTDLASQHEWGFGLSQPLPVMLNAPYSVRQGEGGLERLGTSDEIGQETLGRAK